MEGGVWEIRKYGNNFKRHVTPLPSILRSKPSSLLNSSLFLHSYPCPTKQKKLRRQIQPQVYFEACVHSLPTDVSFYVLGVSRTKKSEPT